MNFKITGTPGEPVRLDTLEAGDWYVPENAKATGSQYPAAVSTNKDDYKVSVRAYSGMPHADSVYLLVHPLTRHELAYGIEYRHINPEPKGDIRPIGELPVGTEIESTEETEAAAFSWIGSRFVTDDVVSRDGNEVRAACSENLNGVVLSPNTPVRVIAYPPDTCPACNGTGVKPAPEPEPTYLERLPEAVRGAFAENLAVFVERSNSKYAGEKVENIARTIFEYMVPKDRERLEGR